MTPAEAAKAAGISRQGLMKSICEGNFMAGGVEFVGARQGTKWQVVLPGMPIPPPPEQKKASLASSTPPSPRTTAAQPAIAGLKVKQLMTKIKLDEQKLAEHDRTLRRRFAECVNLAVKSAGADFAGRARALRLPPEQAAEVGKLGQALKDEIRKRFIEELEEWEQLT